MLKNKGTKLCKYCKTEITADAKAYTNCTKKQSSIRKWTLVALTKGISDTTSTKKKDTVSDTAKTDNSSGKEDSKSDAESSADSETVSIDDNIPAEYQSALNSAKTYSDFMHMSKSGIYNQLISENGDKFRSKHSTPLTIYLPIGRKMR